ncbi:hypothetical protein [Aquamicrobium zhengzhouense]|uniref:Uncharacterized protein n=1 Tax=Aquamicrobium zhengzhouense TaxID=2781738 RepID=A0ABS0S9P3_9HYPH|nr:hypothetical protein [Aquamicrobium zhengzhouense]MBI1620013.1 hypothetical protein [Aquamicrobium zhengzhouense]
MLIKALTSIEGSRKSQNPVINPNSVFEADDKTAKRLLDMGAAREATKEDIALAKVHGLMIETADKPAPDTGKADTKPAAAKGADKPKTDAKPDAKSDDPL